MKTAISLPDEVFEMADSLAGKLKVSRSKLYSMALEKFIREYEKDDITKRLNEHIEKYGQPIDPVFLNTGLNDLQESTQHDTW